MDKKILPPAKFLLWRGKSLLLPVIFLGVTLLMSIELYRYAYRGMDTMSTETMPTTFSADNPLLPLLIFNITLVLLVVTAYVFQQLRAQYAVMQDFFEEEKTGYVRRTADALRTPLTGLRWLTEMMMAGDMGKINKRQQESIEKMHSTTQRMIMQTNELLKVAKISGGLIHYRPVESDMSLVVHKAVEAVSPLAEAHHQKISIISKQESAIKTFDPNLLQHVLEVFLENACHLSKPHTTITLRMRDTQNGTTLSIEAHPEHAGTVRPARKIDTAPGIDQAQPDEYCTDVNMSVSYEIIQAAKAELWIEHTSDSLIYSIILP